MNVGRGRGRGMRGRGRGYRPNGGVVQSSVAAA